MNWYDRPVLTGDHVRLEPLSPDHAEGLHEAGKDPDVWTWLSNRQPTTLDETRAYVERSLADPTRLAWAQVDPRTNEVVGTTSYYEIDPKHRGLYIGHTWIGTRWQRTALNTDAKLLLLSRAFEDLKALRVGWHTDLGNERSQRAIERLGATREGVLRVHRIRPNGTLRDTVVYSMTAAEWPAAKATLTT
ncbi:RimJ/RimL family protein N-acetyltransferase [Saccharothrix ecbatanensis]|jgi:RimJ/RimL family protein N-acetyltransferase|uniref:RimJ/RimL family protein N-acetyltransferase n=1 Tax=Saccharothrix ecbatanensis TaxID=1105145 RepID=A0A7W9HRH0_9PSEU|nr:GNAT family protein [Saccharothrix ecbatanensis]MBB5807127.1 RimJ/RimL family protein N-acetyltransferase [Saccharothrix ecbatanensis]